MYHEYYKLNYNRIERKDSKVCETDLPGSVIKNGENFYSKVIRKATRIFLITIDKRSIYLMIFSL